MAKGPRYHVQFRRRREGKTDYRHRKRLLTSGLPRAVVRCTSRNIYVQLAEFQPKGDVILASASTKELAKLGWKHRTGNTPSAYLVGLLAGQRAMKAKVRRAVLDIGLRSPTRGSKPFAALKGLLDAGLDIAHDDGVLPADDRLNGSHIGDDLPKTFGTVVDKIKGGA
jgi:large subunit ribosomal protein L18